MVGTRTQVPPSEKRQKIMYEIILHAFFSYQIVRRLEVKTSAERRRCRDQIIHPEERVAFTQRR